MTALLKVTGADGSVRTTAASRRSRAFVLSEDRPDGEVGLRLAVASFMRHCPASPLFVYRRDASPAFTAWLRRTAPGAVLSTTLPPFADSWNCKPFVLAPRLAEGFDEVVWIDADILLTRDPNLLFDRCAPDAVVATEEAHGAPDQGSRFRTEEWHLVVGREMPRTACSCVVRFTRQHATLVHAWQRLLSSPEYLKWQVQTVALRPPSMKGDQDALTALLGSEAFAHTEVSLLRHGIDIIHCGGALGYSLRQRWAGMFRPEPTFLHAVAGKPWNVLHARYADTHTRWFTWYRRILQEVSPYVARARGYREAVGLDTPWLDYATPLGLLLRALSFNHHPLRGLPLTIAAMLTSRR